MSCRIVSGLALLFAVHACAHAKPATPAQTAPMDGGMASSAVRDSALATHLTGRLQIIVRPADRPTQPLPDAQVLLRMRQRDTVSRVTDEHGVASFDSLAVGDYEVVIRRIGYGYARASVPIKPGCRTDAEAFLALSLVGIDPPPPKAGRVTIATC